VIEEIILIGGGFVFQKKDGKARIYSVDLFLVTNSCI